jgi:hypothetical protein
MPYQRPGGRFERANRLGHVPTARNDAVSEALRTFHLSVVADGPDLLDGRVLPLAEVPGDDAPQVSLAVALDGSMQELPVRDAPPSVKVGYFQVAGVFVDLTRLLTVDDSGLVDPRAIADSVGRGLLSGVVPASNVFVSPGMSTRQSWRRRTFDLFTDPGIGYATSGGGIRTLLDVLLRLLGEPDRPATTVTLRVCPYAPEEENSCPGRDLVASVTEMPCPTCGGEVYPTDVLRIGEEVVDEGSNLTSLGRLMSTIELLSMLAYVTSFWEETPQALGVTAFIIDGPLALFGPQAPLKRRVSAYLQNLYGDLRARELHPPVIVGLEKGGRFADHGRAIADYIEPGHMVTLDDTYINARVRGGHTPRTPYGKDEFYGRRFYYKTLDGRMTTLTVPRYPTGAPYAEAGSENLADYPTLGPTLRTLDRIGTRLYQDAVIPVALAHSYAAYPLGTGSDVLRLLAQQSLGLTSTASTGRPDYRN